MTHTFASPGSVPAVVAEVGSSHAGSLDAAIRLIRIAGQAGCCGVKFQLYDSERLARQRHSEGLVATYAPWQVPLRWLPILRECAGEHDLWFVLSVYDEQNVDDALLWADVLKVSSFESGDPAFLDYVARKQRPVIVSAGMATHDSLIALARWRARDHERRRILHCISSYPAPLDQMDLRVIEAYGLDGLSDHSACLVTGAVAVACGATLLEVHICEKAETFPAVTATPDYRHSLDPDALTAYVRNARAAAKLCGCRRRQINECEYASTAYRRTSA